MNMITTRRDQITQCNAGVRCVRRAVRTNIKYQWHGMCLWCLMCRLSNAMSHIRARSAPGRMTADRGPKYTFYTYVYLFLYFAISWIRRAARTKSAPGSPAKLHHSVHCACGGASWGSDLARGARLIQRDAR